MVLLCVADGLLSCPSVVYAVAAKYQLPDARLLSVYVVGAVPGTSMTCVRLDAEVP